MAAGDESSPLHGMDIDAVTADNGSQMARNSRDKRGLMATVIARHGGREAKRKKFSMPRSAQCSSKVDVDPDLSTIRVPRVAGVGCQTKKNPSISAGVFLL